MEPELSKHTDIMIWIQAVGMFLIVINILVGFVPIEHKATVDVVFGVIVYLYVTAFVLAVLYRIYDYINNKSKGKGING